MNSPAIPLKPIYLFLKLNTINIIVLNIIDAGDLLKSSFTWI